MKIQDIVSTNTKGQLVIPKAMREQLSITSDSKLYIVLRGNSIYISPIQDVITRAEVESSYIKLLEKTRGTWGEEGESTDHTRSEKELHASSERKKQW